MSRDRLTASDRVVELPELLARLEPEREAGRTIVFTNGCFDILHAGHLHLLEAAAELGDILVVGLNGDNSMRRLKGPSRPWIGFRERALLLAGLRPVDWVVGFDTDTPEELIEGLLPDMLVKGGDWAPDRIVGRETVERHGGRVVSVPLLPDRSTSGLIERIVRHARSGGTSGPER